MTRRVKAAAARPYHGFPWSPQAVRYACELATIHEREPVLPRVSLRAIAAELFNRGKVAHKPSAKAVARMLGRELPLWRNLTNGVQLVAGKGRAA